jgi:hypothetical protein
MTSEESAATGDYGEWTWLHAFDDEDLTKFMNEIRDALIVAAREESAELLEETLYRWRTTA